MPFVPPPPESLVEESTERPAFIPPPPESLVPEQGLFPAIGNAIAREATTGIGRAVQGATVIAQEAGTGLGMVDPETGGPTALALEMQREGKAPPTRAESLEVARKSAPYQFGQEIVEGAKEAYPIDEAREHSLPVKAGEMAGGFLPMVAAGPLAPAVIGAQSYGAHIEDDWNAAKEKGASDDDAANFAMNRALASGALQSSIFLILPKPLRAAGEKFLIDRFGTTAVKKFLAGRVALGAEGAVLGATSTAGENVVSGRPITEGVAAGAAGLGAVNLLLPPYHIPRRAKPGAGEFVPPSPDTPPEEPPVVKEEAPATNLPTSETPPVPVPPAEQKPLNPGGSRAELPPDLQAIEAENAAKQKAIAEEFKRSLNETQTVGAQTKPVQPEHSTKIEFAESFDPSKLGGRFKFVSDYLNSPDERTTRLSLAGLNAEGLKNLLGYFEWKKTGSQEDALNRLVDFREDLRRIENIGESGLSELGNAELDAYAKKFGLSTIGNKPNKVARLLNWLNKANYSVRKNLAEQVQEEALSEAVRSQRPISVKAIKDFGMQSALEGYGYKAKGDVYEYAGKPAMYSVDDREVSGETLTRLINEAEQKLKNWQNGVSNWQQRSEQYTRESADESLDAERREFATKHTETSKRGLEMARREVHMAEARLRYLRGIAESKPKIPAPEPPRDLFAGKQQEIPIQTSTSVASELEQLQTLREIGALTEKQAERLALLEKPEPQTTRRTKSKGSALVEQGGWLLGLTESAGKVPAYIPPGWVISKRARIMAKKRAGGLLTMEEKDWMAKNFPPGYEDNFAEAGFRDAYEAAKKAGIANEIFAKTDKPGAGVELDQHMNWLAANRPGDWTAPKLWDAIKTFANEYASRKGNAGGMTTAEQAELAHQEQRYNDFQAAIAPAKGKLPINTGEIANGAQFTIQGEKVTAHVNFDENGEVASIVLDDGKKFGSQTVSDGKEIHIDPGSLKQPDFDFLTPEAESAATPAPKVTADKLADLVSQLSAKDAIKANAAIEEAWNASREKQLHDEQMRVGTPESRAGAQTIADEFAARWIENNLTQEQRVESALTSGPRTAGELAEELGIISHNIRRILGEGAKTGKFERIARGVYGLKNENGSYIYVEATDSVAAMPKLADEGVKADFIFLDPPYKTAAVVGGNRGVKNYFFITPEQFNTVVEASKRMARTPDSPIYYMHSKAPSGLREMNKYTEAFARNGFKLVAEGQWNKTFKDGTPVTNPRGDVAAPEGIALFNQSGKMPNDTPPALTFTMVRPPVAGEGGRQSQKPIELYNELLGFFTKEVPAAEKPNFVTVDPFAGTLGLAEASKRQGVSNISYEIDEQAINKFKGRIEEAPSPKSSEPVLPAQPEAAEKGVESIPEAQPERKAPGEVNNYESMRAFTRSIYEGEVTADQIKSAWKQLAANREAIKVDLGKLSVKELKEQLHFPRGRNKAELVEEVLGGYESAFFPKRLSYTMSDEGSYERAKTAAVESWTDELVKSRAEERKQAMEERRSARAKLIEGLKNPQTLEDFENVARYHKKGLESLTPEQRARYDELKAASGRENRQLEAENRASVQATELPTGVSMKLVETKHTQKGHDLFVVQLSDRVARDKYNELNTRAKKLGGYFSSYNKGGAIPGFQFKTKADAESFMSLEHVSGESKVAERVEEKRDNAASTLKKQAETLKAKADEKLSAERKTNTARRVAMAEGIEARARADMQMAETMENLAAAIESGEARNLNGVRTRAHVEELDDVLRSAKAKRANTTNEKYDSYSQRPPVVEDIEFARYPKFELYKDIAAGYANQLREKQGGKQLSDRLFNRAQAAGEKLEITRKEAETIIDKLGEKEAWHIADKLKSLNRLEAMGLPDIESLRAALREYIEYRGKKQEQDPIKKLERALVGQKIAGFFPTPIPLAEEMVDRADIKPGQKVLEPSAGNGNVADAIKNKTGVEPTVVEYNYTLRDLLAKKGHKLSDVSDFLEFKEPQDRILMNPPFENGQDIAHVKHAYELLKPGGKIVAIMGEGAFFRSDKKATEFRNWLESVGGTSEKLPEGTFKGAEQLRETGTNARLVEISKPEAQTAKPPAEARFKQGDDILFVPKDRKQSEVSGIITDVIRNQDGEVGYHVLSPLPGDPSRQIRVWESSGTIGIATGKESSLPEGITVTRDKDFQRNGTYTVTDGKNTDKIYRDPETRWWFSDADTRAAQKTPFPPHPLSTENRAEAIQKLVDRWKKEERPQPPAMRSLTKKEQAEFEELSLKAKAARESGSPGLTTEETQRYQKLEGLAGAQDLLSEPAGANEAAERGEIARLRRKAAELERQADLAMKRANSSTHRYEEYYADAQKLEKARTEALDDANRREYKLQKSSGEDLTLEGEVERKEEAPAPKAEEEPDLFNQPKKIETPAPELKKQPENFKYRVGNSPQLWTLLERLEQSAAEKENNEQPVKIRNDKSGKEEVVLEQDLTPVREHTKEERAAEKAGKSDLDQELRDAGLDPDALPNDAAKREALKREKALNPSKFKKKAEALAAKLDALKSGVSGKKGDLGTFNVIPAVWDAAVSAAQAVIRAGGTVADAVAAAINHIRQNQNDEWDEAGAEKSLRDWIEGKLSAARIEASQSEIQRLARPKVEELQRAERELDERFYSTQQARDAKSTILRGIEYARTRVMQSGEEQAIPGMLSPDLAEFLSEHGVPSREIPFLQEAIRMENSARSLANKMRQLEAVQDRIKTLQKFGDKFQEQIDAFRETEEELSQNISRRRPNPRNRPARDEGDPMAGDWDAIVRRRAREIRSQRANQPELEAKRDALHFPEIQETFVKPIDSAKPLLEEFNEANLKFETVLADENAKPEQKRSAAIGLIDSIYRLGYARQKFQEFYDSRRETLRAEIRKLEEARRNAGVRSGLAEVLLDDAMRTMMGERGLSGTIQDRALQENLRDSYSAVITMAERLQRHYGENTARRMLESLIDPSSAPGEPITAENLGISQPVFDNIINWLSRSREFNDAVQTLVQMSARRIADLPITQLESLEQAVEGGNQQEVTDLLRRIQRRATHAMSAADAAQASINRQLYDKGVEVGALDEANAVFDSVFGTKARPNREFETLHKKAVAETGMGREMVVDNGGDPSAIGGNSVTYRAFGDRKTDLVVRANDSILSSGESFRKVKGWFDDAEKYLKEFYSADSAFQNGLSDKSPEQLGYDRATANGLEYALIERYPVAYDPAANVEAVRLQPNWFVRMMSNMKYWRQFLRGSEFSKGSEHRDLVDSMTRYFNSRLDAAKVIDRYKPYIARARSAALRSHPELKNNLEEYVERVWNPMATFGRREDSPLAIGMNLGNGFTVTSQDMALMDLQMRLGRDSRNEVTETTPGRGQQVSEAVRGIRVGYGGDTFRRRSGSVGKYGLPRVVSGEGRQVVSDMMTAYKDAPKFDDATDFSAESQNPVVRFWNENRKSLVRHVMDALVPASDRLVQRTDYMQRAEAKLAAKMLDENSDLGIRTVQDVIEALTGPDIFPEGTGLDALGYVRTELMRELGRYHVEAGKHVREAAARAASTGTEVGRTMENEFTRPANKLWLPSNLFENGAVSDGQILAYGNRMSSEGLIRFSSALDRAYAALTSEIEKVTQDKIDNYQGDLSTVQASADILKNLRTDLIAANKNPQFSSSAPVSQGVTTIKSALLANPNVGWRNISLGQMEIYMMNQAIDRHSRALAFLNQQAQFAKTLAVAAKGLIYDPAAQVVRGTRKFLAREGRGDFETWLQMLSEATTNKAKAQVNQTGFSNRQPIWLALGNEWRRLREYDSRLEQVSEGKRPIRRGFRYLAKTAQTGFRWVGTEVADIYLNFMAIDRVNKLADDLEKVAQTYGSAREGLGKFDPTDQRWIVKPEEYSRRLTRANKEANLAAVRQLLRRSGMTLEHLLWDFYQGQKRGEKAPPMFSQAETTNIQRAVMREYNASDMSNRPVAMTTDPIFRMLAHFQGYSSDFTLKLMENLNGMRGQGYAQRLATALPTIVGLGLVGLILGQESLAGSKPILKSLGITPNYSTMFEPDWWKNSDQRKRSAAMGLIAAFPIVGDLIALGMNTVVGNRGFSPSGRILAFNLLDSGINVLRGLFTNTERVSDKLIPLSDEARRWLFFYNSLARALSSSYRENSDYRTGVSTLRTAMQGAGVPIETKPGQQAAFTGSVGPTRRIVAAMSERNVEALREAFEELVDYHRQRGAADPEKSALATLSSMNPAQRAGGGRKPTADEFQRSLEGMTPENRERIQKLFDDFTWASSILSGNAPSFQRAESGGGGGGGGQGLSASGSSSPSRLRGALSSIKARAAKVKGVKTRLTIGKRPRQRRLASALRRSTANRGRIRIASRKAYA